VPSTGSARGPAVCEENEEWGADACWLVALALALFVSPSPSPTLLHRFIIGFQITHSLGSGALSSGASTIFVALAEDPMMLAERDPQLFEMIRQTYPKVVTPV